MSNGRINLLEFFKNVDWTKTDSRTLSLPQPTARYREIRQPEVNPLKRRQFRLKTVHHKNSLFN